MARVIVNPSQNPINIFKVSVIGLVSGGIFYGLYLILVHHLPSITAGHVAMIVAATISLFIMVFLKSSRPLIVVLASLASLWNLNNLISYLNPIESIIASLIIYTLAYSFFGWVAYVKKTSVALIIALVVTVAIHFISTSTMIQ